MNGLSKKTPWHVIKEGETFVIADNLGVELFIADNEITRNFPEEAEANANLVAAAPDLLDSLEAMFTIATEAGWELEVMDNVRATIAKAKGAAA